LLFGGRPLWIIFDDPASGKALPVNPNDQKYPARSGVSAWANKRRRANTQLTGPMGSGLIAVISRMD
jgi:hypothetical protein